MISLSAQLVTALGYLEQAPRSFETRFRGICTPAARGRNWDFRQRLSYHLEATGRNNSGIMTLCAAFSYREAKHILQSMMETICVQIRDVGRKKWWLDRKNCLFEPYRHVTHRGDASTPFVLLSSSWFDTFFFSCGPVSC